MCVELTQHSYTLDRAMRGYVHWDVEDLILMAMLNHCHCVEFTQLYYS